MTQDKPTAMMELIQFILDNRGSQKDILDEAKSLLEKEKTQIVDAYNVGQANAYDPPHKYKTGEQYFTQTYKQ